MFAPCSPDIVRSLRLILAHSHPLRPIVSHITLSAPHRSECVSRAGRSLLAVNTLSRPHLPSPSQLCGRFPPRPTQRYSDSHIPRSHSMTLPTVVVDALQHLLNAIPTFDTTLFIAAHRDIARDVSYGAATIRLTMSGMSYSEPFKMGYAIILTEVVGVDSHWTKIYIWLLNVSEGDPEQNRRAFALAVQEFIKQNDDTIFMQRWDVATMSPA
ncbi:hypothetical protein C8Q77DRAFT_1125835 [Trametes polyzona]|nr:hypothetical protein C8Q77DRAFT_1125835 [Trametes polyzona]